MDLRKFGYDIITIQMQTVRTPTTCKPMSTVTLDLAQILTLASVFYFFHFTFEKKAKKRTRKL